MPEKMKKIGNELIELDRIPSTNDYAFKLALDGKKEGCVVIATEQTAGKGRLGRKWDAPAYLGLWFSIILRPPAPTTAATLYPFFASVAIVKAIQKLFHLTPDVKWPNDLLLNQKKFCGILTEAAFEQQKIKFLVLGIGINTNQTPEDFLPELRKYSTSIRHEIGEWINNQMLFHELLAQLNLYYSIVRQQGFAPILKLWKSFCQSLGQTIALKQPEETMKGIFHNLDPDGGLILRQEDGRLVKILSGDLDFLKK
ncbi:biotin--[acetyl-CoA-carboxylase] ligase [candidate division KSB1 bacterium]|nr:biotin--[acetyl-CoA-carboxylase] ligase [candidate division KSB1 bacterium]